jgi:hypothetical protein
LHLYKSLQHISTVKYCEEMEIFVVQIQKFVPSFQRPSIVLLQNNLILASFWKIKAQELLKPSKIFPEMVCLL